MPLECIIVDNETSIYKSFTTALEREWLLEAIIPPKGVDTFKLVPSHEYWERNIVYHSPLAFDFPLSRGSLTDANKQIQVLKIGCVRCWLLFLSQLGVACLLILLCQSLRLSFLSDMVFLSLEFTMARIWVGDRTTHWRLLFAGDLCSLLDDNRRLEGATVKRSTTPPVDRPLLWSYCLNTSALSAS